MKAIKQIAQPVLCATRMGGLGTDCLSGGCGNDIIEGGDDSDVISGDGRTEVGSYDSVTANLHGNEFIDGGAGNDFLYGQGGNDEIYGVLALVLVLAAVYVAKFGEYPRYFDIEWDEEVQLHDGRFTCHQFMGYPTWGLFAIFMATYIGTATSKPPTPPGEKPKIHFKRFRVLLHIYYQLHSKVCAFRRGLLRVFMQNFPGRFFKTILSLEVRLHSIECRATSCTATTQ